MPQTLREWLCYGDQQDGSGKEGFHRGVYPATWINSTTKSMWVRRKKIGNDVVFGPGLGTMDSGTKTAIENLTGYAPTKSFIELKVQWKKTTVSYCPLPSMPGKQ